ncbi:MAG: penicillin-binding protein 2 [Bacteroidaceae bacterium]|nr:penicillin-binding protein 2 [Bacteroidaceae bacterium]
MRDFMLERRKFVIGGIALFVVLCYVIRLSYLQLAPNDYRKIAESNAIYNKIIYPSRGAIYDRKGRLLVFNQPAYDIMVITREAKDFDTLDLCETLHMTRQEFEQRLEDIKDLSKNPGYSSYTQQLFQAQISAADFSIFQEKMFRFNGFYVRERTGRQYKYPCAAHILGDVAEVSPTDIEQDDYYMAGDFIGKQGVERSYEKVLRGEKGVEVLLRDSRGKIQGHFQNGELDRKPKPGKDIFLSIDIELQMLGERLMQGKKGSIVAIEPSTGEVLCLVSSPTYNPRDLIGKNRGKKIMDMVNNPSRPMLNRAISGAYPPGSTFKPSQALTFLQEGIVSANGTYYPCNGGFRYKNSKLGCHAHTSPISLIPALATSCNGYFCWGLLNMFGNRSKYPTVQDAMTTWKDYMVSMGFGYKLGIDMPGEVRGMIPNADYYDEHLRRWNALTVISISIGQGEVTLTPLQIANQGATIANRGHYITPHVVKGIKGGAIADSLHKVHHTKVNPKYYDYIVSGMRSAVLTGTCKGAQNPWYEVCGKTGTAQNRGHDHSAFMGFAPKNNPQIAIAVYVENGGYGNAFGVPIGALMMEQYIRGELSPDSKVRASGIQHRSVN